MGKELSLSVCSFALDSLVDICREELSLSVCSFALDSLVDIYGERVVFVSVFFCFG